jgi:hypothetical protein
MLPRGLRAFPAAAGLLLAFAAPPVRPASAGLGCIAALHRAAHHLRRTSLIKLVFL